MTTKVIVSALSMVGVIIAATCIVRASSSDEDRLLAKRIIRIRGPINDRLANDVIARLLFLQKQSVTEPIELMIDSPGGEVSPGLAILDTLEIIKAPVGTRCEGAAHSMAMVILVCGHRGFRSVSDSVNLAFFMPQAPTGGSAQQKVEAERFAGILIRKVVQATGAPEPEVVNLFVNSTPISGKQAYQLHLVDKIE